MWRCLFGRPETPLYQVGDWIRVKKNHNSIDLHGQVVQVEEVLPDGVIVAWSGIRGCSVNEIKRWRPEVGDWVRATDGNKIAKIQGLSKGRIVLQDQEGNPLLTDKSRITPWVPISGDWIMTSIYKEAHRIESINNYYVYFHCIPFNLRHTHHAYLWEVRPADATAEKCGN